MQPPGWLHLLLLLLSLLSVPAVQILAVYWKSRVAWHTSAILSYRCPKLRGGMRHAVFTMMSWLTWTVSVAFAAPVVSPASPIPVPATHLGALYGASVACSIVSLVFNIKALIVFEVTQKRSKKSTTTRVLSNEAGFLVVLALGMVLALMSGMILVAADHLPDTPSQLLYCLLSICCALIAASSTHGLGGHIRHASESEQSTGWRFFQPFRGGQVFVASQGLGWTLFAVFIACVLRIMGELWHGLVVALRWWAFRTGGIILLTQMILGFSLLTFRTGVSVEESLIQPLGNLIAHNLPIILLYLSVHIVIGVWVATFTLLPAAPVFKFWVTVLSMYYVATSIGSPTHTGCRKWGVVRTWFTRHLTACLILWQGKAELVYAGKSLPNPSRSYIFGFHPHGLYPLGAVVLSLLSGFSRLFPSISPATLAANMLFFPPLQRDLLHWWGVREVGRASFIRALKDEKAVILCPGGQEELVETYKLFQKPSELVICTRHKGFCRLAIEHQACLVPVLALGEAFTVQNVIDLPKLQMATYRIFGFPIPYLLVGRWGFSPLPKRVPLIYVMGEPIEPPNLTPGGTVTQEAVDILHAKYYGHLQELFHRYKGSHALYTGTEIVLKNRKNE